MTEWGQSNKTKPSQTQCPLRVASPTSPGSELGGMEVSETLVLEVGGYQFLYLSSEQWIWTCSVQVLCVGGVCLDEPFSLKRPKTLLSLSVNSKHCI